jgi:hypothetical protein
MIELVIAATAAELSAAERELERVSDAAKVLPAINLA